MFIVGSAKMFIKLRKYQVCLHNFTDAHFKTLNVFKQSVRFDLQVRIQTQNFQQCNQLSQVFDQNNGSRLKM